MLDALRRRLPPAPAGETWIGDDAAVLVVPTAADGASRPGAVLLAADALVAGVHADLDLTTVADLGWKALATNVSDVAAMGGRPWRAVVTVAAPDPAVVEPLYDGLLGAAAAFDCPIVGGDLTGGPALVVTVAITGLLDGPPVLRSGASAGDHLLVTGPLGAAAAGLAALRAGRGAEAPALVDAHRRPVARVPEGLAARRAGATAMMDLSDGLAVDLRRLARASGVGADLDAVPVAPGATAAEALGGGDDYELLLAVADPGPLRDAFAAAGLRPPVAIGRCTADAGVLALAGEPLPTGGWEHRW